MARPLILGPALRPTCIVLQVLPVPGVGAIIAGAKNPHSRLLGRGIAQAALVVFGSYPLIIPGAAGLLWAIWDAARIARDSGQPTPWTEPAPDADPETVTPTRAQKAEVRRGERGVRRAERQADRAEKQAVRAEQKAERAAAAQERAAAKAARATERTSKGDKT